MRLFLIGLLILTVISADAQIRHEELYSMMLDSINVRLNGYDSITVPKNGKFDPVNGSDEDFMRIANPHNSNCNFLILKEHWPLEKEEYLIENLVGAKKRAFYIPAKNYVAINAMVFEGRYLYQFVPDKTIEAECPLMDLRYNYNNDKTDTIFYHPFLLQFTNIFHNNGNTAIAYAVYRSAIGSSGSRSFGFVFKKKNTGWYIEEVVRTGWDRW